MHCRESLLRVEALEAQFDTAAEILANRLGLPRTGQAAYALQFAPEGLQLTPLGAGASGPVRVDFVSGAVAHRRQFGGGAGQMIAKAVGVQPGIRPTVLDATAGLGKDAFVLAQIGCEVTLVERQPVIAALLADGLQRAADDAEVQPIIARMALIDGDAIAAMSSWMATVPEVVYLDPMFPHRDKSALVKKEMRVFRDIVGDDDDAPALLAAALALASHRVVVKRPRKAPPIDGPIPGLVLEGKSSRYDIYPIRSLRPRKTASGSAHG